MIVELNIHSEDFYFHEKIIKSLFVGTRCSLSAFLMIVVDMSVGIRC